MSIPRLRFSHLKYMPSSPLDVRAAQETEYEETLSMRLGSGFHARIEGRPIAIATMPRSKKLTDAKGLPTAYATWLSDQPENVLVLTAREYEDSARMAEAVMTHPIAGPLIRSCTEIERTVKWTMLGIDCEGTPDCFSRDILIELKSDKEARVDRFQRTGKFRGYPGQVDWYRNALERLELLNPSADKFTVCVRNNGRPAVVVHRMTPSILDYGRRLWSGWFERYKVCHDSQYWPDVAATIVDWEDDEQQMQIETNGEQP